MGNHLKWAGEEEMNFPEGTEDFVQDLKTSIRKRGEAKVLDAQAKVLKSEANQLAKVAMPILGLEKCMSNLGGLTYVGEGKTSTTNIKGVKEYLLSRGVNANMLKAAFDKNTKEGTKASYVKFVDPK